MQLSVLGLLAADAPMTPYAVASKLRWGRGRYPSARQACLRLAAKGLAAFHTETYGLKMMKQTYQPTAPGLLELIYRTPRNQLNKILTRSQNKKILPLLEKVDEEGVLIACLNEVWRDIRIKSTLRMSAFEVSSKAKAKALQGKRMRPFHEKNSTMSEWRLVHKLVKEVEDEFYQELFTRPFEPSASPTPQMKRFRRLIMSDAQLSSIARRIIANCKLDSVRKAVKLEKIESQLGAGDEQRGLQQVLRKMYGGSMLRGADLLADWNRGASEIVAEVLNPLPKVP
jgi:hypothetical protein